MAKSESPLSAGSRSDANAVSAALRAQKPFLLVTLALYALAQLLYVTATPLQMIDLPDNVPLRAGTATAMLVGIGPDEKEYMLYIRSIAESGALPAPAPSYRRSADDYVSYQVQHPPLFFLLAAIIYRLVEPLIGMSAFWYVIRCVCALCGGGAVVLASRAAAIAFPKSDFIVLAAPPTLAFLPIFAHMCANLSSEPLEMLLGACAWLQMAAIVRGLRPRTVPTALLLGATIGLAALSKLTAVILLPAGIASLCLGVSGNKARSSSTAARVGGFFAPIVLFLAPWFIRNRMLFGAFFPRPFDRPQLAGITLLQYLADVNQPLSIAGLPRPMTITPLMTVLNYASTAWTPFWLIQFYLPGGIQTAAAWQGIAVLAIALPLILLFLHASHSRRDAALSDPGGREIVWMASSIVFFAVVGVLQQQLYADWDAIFSAGRYFVAAAPVGTLLLLFAISTTLRSVPSRARVAAALVGAIMLAFDVSSALFIRHFYADHPTQAPTQRIEE